MRSVYLKILLIFFMMLFCGCQPHSNSNPSSKNQVIIAIDATFIPMAFMNQKNQLDGFEVDLIKEVTREANLDYELVILNGEDCLGV